MGHGAITFWKDGREVYDNVSCIYVYDNGVKINSEETPPTPAFLQMINDLENELFDVMPFAGTSWAPETANKNSGEYLLGKRPKDDGPSLKLNYLNHSR